MLRPSAARIVVSSLYNALDRVVHSIEGDPLLETVQATLTETMDT